LKKAVLADVGDMVEFLADGARLDPDAVFREVYGYAQNAAARFSTPLKSRRKRPY
jgi:hypothetical protein